MSHSTGEARFEDGEILFFEMNNTVDQACTALKRTHDEISRDWRSEANCAKCTCGAPGEPVVLVDSATGEDKLWDSTACRRCMAITGHLNDDHLWEQPDDYHAFR